MGFRKVHTQLKRDQKDYFIQLVAFHVVIAFLIYFVPFLAKVYFLGVLVYFILKVFSARDYQRPKEVLYACCYIVGAEVVLRMTSGTFLYEGAKYAVVLFVLLGLFSNGVSRKSYPYFFYLLFLFPSIVVAAITIGYDSNLRTNIAFVLSGPVCLGLSALYFHDKKVKFGDLLKALNHLGLPIVTTTIYLFLYNPSVKAVLSGTASNFATSGGFGPNQVATVLGLGMFVFTVRLFLKSPNLVQQLLNAALLGLVSYRGIVTFSRGGIFTGIILIALFLFSIFKRSSSKRKGKIIYTAFFLSLIAVSVWVISSNETQGLIDKRYANQDAAGREKEDLSTGRFDIFMSDLEGFVNNPFLGVGANGAKELRLKKGEGLKASHNEISRLLSEHGLFAIFILLILIFTPLSYRLNHKNNIFFYAFLAFWFATINHSAMRIAAPALIYALALLNVQYEKRPLRRKRIIQNR